MSKPCWLEVKWQDCSEFIDFDAENPHKPGKSIDTEEQWEAGRVTYCALVEKWTQVEGHYEIRLRYEKRKNSHIAELDKSYDLPWGRSEIRIDLSTMKGSAVWINEPPSTNFDGPARSVELFEEYGIETVNRIQRKRQAKLRRVLLERYGSRCALLGETAETVLDLAHLVPVGRKGSTSEKNCILLRTDLHRLFDGQFFEFRVDGTVSLDGEKLKLLPKDYLDLLKGKKMDVEVQSYVKQTLAKKQKNGKRGT